ncbi:MAG: hypothetical protein Q4P16_08570, partial [Spirochaetales bacterium]|nr:hypothetical protein [Spirochaetales bacterium]
MPSNADKPAFLNHNYNKLLLYGADYPVKPDNDMGGVSRSMTKTTAIAGLKILLPIPCKNE